MSGDVQPRKRKDKKRKKDELGVDEAPRGTAAALGEGDVFMHSPNEHGTGGHWCAKIIFFSLLAVLVTLIGLIILENRGLTELEANSVESQYSGILEGWLEDAPEDDHHDEHTLELKHHDDDEEDIDNHSPEEIDHDDEDDDHDNEDDDHDDGDDDDDDEHDDGDDDDEHAEQDDEDSAQDDENDEREDNDEDENSNELDDDEDGQEHDGDDDDDDGEDGDHDNEDADEENAELDQQDDDNSEERSFDKSNEDDDDKIGQGYGKYEDSGEDNKNNDDDDDLQRVDENDTGEDDERNDSIEHNDDGADEENSDENNQDDNESRENEDEEEEHEDEEEDLEVEVERLEKEVSDDDLSEELPAPELDDDDKSEEISNEIAQEDDADADDGATEDEEFLEPDDIDDALPEIEPIVAPKGKPLVEVEEETPIVKPADTLAEEEEYEKQQEELRREQEQASHMWLKLGVGGALLLATHAVVRRATARRDASASEEHDIREETPVRDRRMTLISEEAAAAIDEEEETSQPVEEENLAEKIASVIKTAPPPKEEIEEEVVEEEEEENEEGPIGAKEVSAKGITKDKELYSDEEEDEEVEEEEEIVEEVKEPPKKAAPTPQNSAETKPTPDDDVPDDVEIIDNEQLEEEYEEEDDEEEEISDVDDAELLSRLEAKYGRLPEPERFGPKPKDGGNSIEDDWPGEPSDQYWRQQLDQAEEELRQGAWGRARRLAGAGALAGSARARWLLARAADAEAEARRDNRLLSAAITAYLHLLKMNERLSDHRLLEVAHRTLDRIRFRGNYLSAEPVYRLLIRRFPDVPDYHNNLTVSFLMANRADLAEQVIKDTLKKWPNDRVALAHHGFVMKTQHNRNEEAVEAFQKALEGDVGPATEPRFYYHLGDSLLLLGRFKEAHEVHKRGAALGHFLSPAQRSLYNVDRLKSQPWWNIEQTPYAKLARALEKSWKEILKEGEAAKALYEKEKEGLKERGEWSQLDLFVRGQEIPNRCKRAPVTCSIVRSEAAAVGCRRGQVKFSAMEAGTHVRPHVGPTNCRLRMHLGLSNTKDTYLRVDQETRQWQVGKTFMFDDSFEHEVWHNGTGTRLVLIVDVWHPALTPAERRTLPAI
ncbi:aspartyl/asparaginyl beta-hydroxylase isoform X1 [Helicoverpa zea]|uniref:aspartyl/asparaginyl beta-hydroxylase isoform X1 n=1 Tax=Helicoverpa zea TaxID=7113 RepID=UPI001F5A060A|nr:aspartyl/asparaginyl beta-hydroxylase isoform X1 [Helicoverpa zea]XP_047026670.1 aspartyl/asparaginyl beta-hydroxylase isoform X1 [Helicoverpa zea]